MKLIKGLVKMAVAPLKIIFVLLLFFLNIAGWMVFASIVYLVTWIERIAKKWEKDENNKLDYKNSC